MYILEQFYKFREVEMLARKGKQQLVWIQNDRGADEAFAKKIYDHLNYLASLPYYGKVLPIHIGCKKDWFDVQAEDKTGIKGYGWGDIIFKTFDIYDTYPNDLHILIGSSGIKDSYLNKYDDILSARSPISSEQCRFYRKLTGFQALVMSTRFFPGGVDAAVETASAFVKTKKQKIDWFDDTQAKFFKKLEERRTCTL